MITASRLVMIAQVAVIIVTRQGKMSASGFNTSFGGNQYNNNFNNTLSSEKKGGPQYKKIFCAYHSTEFLTNFCIDKQCLMPLCPTCVVEHTEEHYECQQKPAYVNLHDALQDSKQKCYSNIIRLEEFSRKNAELSSYIQGLPDYIRKQLAECKEKLYQFIDDKFEAYEAHLIEQIRGKYADEGVYSRKECEQVRDFISGQVESLYDKISQLKGDQCLAALIRYYESDEKTLDNEMNEIQEYVDKNKKAGGLYISLNTEQLGKELEHICEKVVSLEYIQQEAERSFNSTKNLQYQQISNGKKGVMTSSIVNRINTNNLNKSGAKDKPAPKLLSNSLSYSRQKDEKHYYNSPFRPGADF